MKSSKSYIKNRIAYLCFIVATIASCKKDGNPNNLPSVNPADYDGKIDGYLSTEEVFPESQIAYWSFENTANETVSGTSPTRTAGSTFVDGGVRGKALNLAAGFLYFNTQFAKLKTDALKSWTISTWVKVANNGSKKTMVFQLARPGQLNGNINFVLNTNAFNAANDSLLTIQPTFLTQNAGGTSTQDNLNNTLNKTKLTQWTHLALTYDYNTGTFNIYMNGVKVGGFPNRGVGNNLFKSWEPSVVIIGSNINNIPPDAPATADASFAPMTGQIDELRIYNKFFGDAFIKALYNLGKAGK